MPQGIAALPDDFRKLLELVEAGKLFAVKEWIAAGKSLDFKEVPGSQCQLLEKSIQTGFHSMVEVLLQAGGWTSDNLTGALEFARENSRYEIAALLEQFGARGREIDFITACEKLDLASAERLLRAGFNPNENNDFARALRETKAKPLVGFYKNHRAEFPILDDQAAIALRIAVRNNEVRSAALLRWAGANPFRPAPDDLEESYANGTGSEHWSTAAEDAMWRGDAQMLKALHLNPTPEQALRLLRVSAYTHDVPLFTKILASIPRDKINHTERGSCGALEHLVGARPEENFLTSVPNEKGNAEKLQCIELLLDAGARWHPPAEELKSDRRYLLRHDPKYIVQLIRLLLYTPNAADTSLVLELCRSQSLLDKIGAADSALVSEIKEFSKQKLNSANSHSAENRQSKALVLGG